MKIRYLTILTTLVFFGFSGPAAADRCVVYDASHKHCTPEPGDDPSPWYDVTIKGPMGGGDYDDDWGAGEFWKASNNLQVNYQHFDPLPSTGVLNLTFFRDYFETNGLNCFPSVDVQIHAVILSYKRSTGARAQIWFHGFTNDGLTQVLYQLKLNGVLRHKTWPPAEGGANLMTMYTWNMGLANEGNDNQANSCLKEDTDFETGQVVDIDVRSVPAP